MRTFFLSLFALTVAFGQSVRITWIGQSCFAVQNAEGSPTVITDPPAASIGYALPAVAADAVTITHNHTDHNFSAGVRGSFTLVDGRPITARQEMTAAGLAFILIPGFHDNQNGAARGPNTIVRWNQAGLRFAHFGDFGQDALTEAQLADLGDLDVVFMPAGGFFTISPSQAAELIRQLKPRVVIPMHFRTALGGPAQLAAFPAMADPFSNVRFKPSTVAVSRNTLPTTTEVWLLEVDAEAVVVNAAGFTRGMPLAPGSLASVFGRFTGADTGSASSLPLPRQLGNTEVRIGDKAAPLLFVSPGQINFQVPGQLERSQQAVEVRVAGQRVARGSVTVVPTAPGLFAAVNENGRVNSPSNPARRGQVVQIFGTGQGAVTPPVEDGAASPSDPLSRSNQQPSVYFGGRLGTTPFSGLAPGFSGLWQINAVIPSEAPTGANVSVAVIHGLVSNEIPIAIQP